MSIKAHIRVDHGAFQLDAALNLPSQGVTAVFGPSGSGKTTLLRALAGLDRHPDSQVTVQDCVWQNKTDWLAPHERPIGLVFQEPSLFEHLTVQENLDYGRQRIPEEARKVPLERPIDLLAIGPLLNRYPQQLSLGEQQRAALARALAVCPDWLMMDEPLAALDAARKREILPYLETLCRETDLPILYVSHSREEIARLADHLVLLDAGRVTAAGPIAELFSQMDLALTHAPDSAALVTTTVAGHDKIFDLTLLDFAGGQFQVAHHAMPMGTEVRLQVQASDVSLTLDRPKQTSILNIFPAQVTELTDAGPSHTLVKLTVAGTATSLLARITRKSADQLGLEPGHSIYAQVKSAALLR